MKRRTGAGTIAALMLTTVFGATLLLSIITGAGVYRRVEERVEENASDRVGLTYITAKIHAADEAGRVEVGSFGGQDAVFLYEELGGETYRTALYVYEGSLMELLSEEGVDLSPEDGQTVTAARGLTARDEGHGLLRLVYTDAGGEESEADVFIRSRS